MTETDNLAAALARFQEKLPQIKKTETAQVRSEKGNYTYTYADLADVSAQIMPLLGEVGLAFLCRPTNTADGRFVLTYSLLHVSGEREDGEYPLPTGGSPQQLGSAITYGRRYCLCAVTGAAPDNDDDDAAAAQRPSADRSRQNRDERATPDNESFYVRPPQGPSPQEIADAAHDKEITVDAVRTLWDQAKRQQVLDAEVADPATGEANDLRSVLTDRGQVAKENEAAETEDQAATAEAAAETGDAT